MEKDSDKARRNDRKTSKVNNRWTSEISERNLKDILIPGAFSEVIIGTILGQNPC